MRGALLTANLANSAWISLTVKASPLSSMARSLSRWEDRRRCVCSDANSGLIPAKCRLGEPCRACPPASSSATQPAPASASCATASPPVVPSSKSLPTEHGVSGGRCARPARGGEGKSSSSCSSSSLPPARKRAFLMTCQAYRNASHQRALQCPQERCGTCECQCEYVHVCARVHVSTCLFGHVHARARTCAHARTCTRAHTRAHTISLTPELPRRGGALRTSRTPTCILLSRP